jgi:hypothetical protein
MSDADEDLYSLRDGLWQVQPRWVKALTLLIAVPAWLVFVTSIFAGTLGGTLQTIAFSAFAAVALLQLAFVVRAFWRVDL